MTLLAFARRPPMSVDVSCPPAPQQQTRRRRVPREHDGTDGKTDRRTDGRTPDSFIDPALHTAPAVSIN